MEPFVRECEKARALRSAYKDADHLQALTAATTLLCEDEEVLRHGVRASVPGNDGACTAGKVIADWYLLRYDPPDDDAWPCLEQVAGVLESAPDEMLETLRDRFGP